MSEKSKSTARPDSKQLAANRLGLRLDENGNYQLDAQSLIASVGGVAGFIEAMVPGVAYGITFAFTHSSLISVIAVSLLALGSIVRSLVLRRPLTQILSIGVSVAFAWALTQLPGEHPINYYLKNIWINAIYLTACVVSISVRWPLIGLLVGALTGKGVTWRADAAQLKLFTWATMLWVLLFSVRLSLEVPLYLAGAVVQLAFLSLFESYPLYFLTIWLTWLLLRKEILASRDGNLDSK